MFDEITIRVNAQRNLREIKIGSVPFENGNAQVFPINNLLQSYFNN